MRLVTTAIILALIICALPTTGNTVTDDQNVQKTKITAADEQTTPEQPIQNSFLIGAKYEADVVDNPKDSAQQSSKPKSSGSKPEAKPKPVSKSRRIQPVNVKADKSKADTVPSSSQASIRQNAPKAEPPSIKIPETSVAHTISFADEDQPLATAQAESAPNGQENALSDGFVAPDSDYATVEKGLEQEMQSEGIGSGVPSAWRGISAALFVVGLVFLLYGIVKWIRPKPLFKVPAEVEVITELPMPGGKKVVLARILDRCYLLGLTKDGITLLDRVADLDIKERTSLEAVVSKRETAEIARQKVITSGLDTAFSGGFRAVKTPSFSSRGTYSPFINRPGEVKRTKAQVVPVKVNSSREMGRPPKRELGFSNGDSARKEYLLSRIRSEIERLS